ncbi:MAG: hypothetical protein KDC05_16390 [Bacteroidales bacterium]|nr:hypothetical protein [Bacteroidales bacterium]
MKLSKNLYFVWFVLAMVIFTACSDKDDDPQPSNNQQNSESPELQTVSVFIPDEMAQSDNPGAMQAVNYISIANSFTGFAAAITPPKSSPVFKSGLDGPWVHSWTFDDGTDLYTVTLTITENSDGYSWDMVITGTLGGNVLENFTYMEAWQNQAGTSGSFAMYDPEGSGEMMQVSWNTSESGVYTCTFEMPQDMIIEIISNPDGSGEVTVNEWYEGAYELTFEAQWDATGHGEYWEYYEGEIVDHGTW